MTLDGPRDCSSGVSDDMSSVFYPVLSTRPAALAPIGYYSGAEFEETLVVMRCSIT